jgi:hypothetical protein
MWKRDGLITDNCCILGCDAMWSSRSIEVCIFDVNKKIQLDATVRRYLFTAKSLYMFGASLCPSSGVLKTVTATSDQTMPEGSSYTNIITYTRGSCYSF